MTTVFKEEQRIARPLKELVPLIHDDLKHAKEAAERASMPYYRAAGEKLLEAKAQLEYGEFGPWLNRNFHLSASTARLYMRLVTIEEENSAAAPFSSLHDFRKQTEPAYAASRSSSWQEPIKKIVQSIDYEALRRDDLRRAEIREEERQLGLKLIDIGYKVLAQQLHPDKKEGSHEAFSHLKNVRDRLRNSA